MSDTKKPGRGRVYASITQTIGACQWIWRANEVSALRIASKDGLIQDAIPLLNRSREFDDFFNAAFARECVAP